LVQCVTELGEFDEATAVSREEVQIAEALDNPWCRALAYYSVATVAVQRGDASQAVAVGVQGLNLCNTYDMTFLWPRLACLSGYSMALAGRHDEGIALVAGALRASEAMRLRQEETLRRAQASEAHLLAGRIHEARDIALGALEIAEQHGQHGSGACAHRILGGIARLHPSLVANSAEHHYREALRLANERGMRPLVAHCHLGLGMLHRRASNHAQAQEHLTIATACTAKWAWRIGWSRPQRKCANWDSRNDYGKTVLGSGCEDPGCSRGTGRPRGVVEVRAASTAESSRDH
jgi:hypothetical protein